MTALDIHPALKESPFGGAPLIPVFVYGTLRIGEGNYLWAREAVRHETPDVTTKGRIYFVRSRITFPVAKFERDGTIKGDLLWFDPEHPVFSEVVDMEVGAGYVVQEIEVEDTRGDTHEALGFQYLMEPQGDWIQNGDWKRSVTRR